MIKLVIIKDESHPWYGQTGTLDDEEKSNEFGMYTVALDNGMKAGCFMRQVEEL